MPVADTLMAYNYEICEKYTSKQIEQWMEGTEYQVQQLKNNAPHSDQILVLQKLLGDLHADLILKKQEEKAEMKQLLSKLLQLVDST